LPLAAASGSLPPSVIAVNGGNPELAVVFSRARLARLSRSPAAAGASLAHLSRVDRASYRNAEWSAPSKRRRAPSATT
jgi:hypothetical protein